MSQSIPPRHQPARPRKPDYKIRPGFSNEELAEFHHFLQKFDMDPGKFTRRTLLAEVRKQLGNEIIEEALS